MRAAVTGAGGFLGSALTRELLAAGAEVVAIDQRPTHPGAFRLALNLEELALVVRSGALEGLDVFYHLAWRGVSAGREDETRQLANVAQAAAALRLAAAAGCKRFVGAGSIMELEALADCAPDRQPGPGMVYGACKLAARQICQSLAPALGIELVWAQITNAYGPGERSPRLICATLGKLLAGEEPAFTAATQLYDFIYVDDAARALRLAGEGGRPFRHYVVGSGSPRPLKEFLLELREAAGSDLPFHFGKVPYRGVSLPPAAYDTTPLEKDTGFRPQTAFSQGIAATMAWLTGEGTGEG